MDKNELRVGDRIRLDLRGETLSRATTPRSASSLPNVPNLEEVDGEEGYVVRVEPRGRGILITLDVGPLLVCERRHLVRLERYER